MSMPRSSSPATLALPVPVQHDRRRSSVAARIGSFADAGGRNSISSFARSWTRASQFPVQRETESVSDSEIAIEQSSEGSLEAGESPLRRSSAGGSSFNQPSPGSPYSPGVGHDGVDARLQQQRELVARRRSSAVADARRQSLFNSSRQDSSRDPSSLLRHRSQDGTPFTERVSDEQTPLIKKVAEPGLTSEHIVGESTFAQTYFNITNCLIGMSMLAVPYAIQLSGWIIGVSAFTLAAFVTAFTGTLLARTMEFDSSGSLSTYDDLAYVAYGPKARAIVRVLFNLELLAVGVALVILGADCFHSLVPAIDVNYWKLICGVVVTPLCALPMRILSFTSVLGIMSSVCIIMVVFIAGLTKSESGGSLHSPASTSAWPDDWSQFPKAFGMLMACYGAHGIFPQFYRDMRSPHKFDRAVFLSYGWAWLVQLLLGTAGYLMYGRDVRNEVTINVFQTPGYARWISTLIIIAMAVLPLTKIPLNARPIIITIFSLLHVNLPPPTSTTTSKSPSANPTSSSPQLPLRHRILRPLTYMLTPFLLVGISILIPSFDRVLAILGNLLCCLISVVLPCLFHLRLYGKEMPLWQKSLEWTLVVVFAVPAVGGTIWSVLPG